MATPTAMPTMALVAPIICVSMPSGSQYGVSALNSSPNSAPGTRATTMPKAEPLSRCIMKDLGVSFSTIPLLFVVLR